MIALVCLVLATLSGPELVRAEHAYRIGRYQEAFTLFEQALAEPNAPQGPVLYAMGNCAFRLGRSAEASLYYRRAALRLPGDPRLAFNLQLAERRLGVAHAPPTVVERLRAALDARSPAELLVLVTLLQTAGLAGVLALRRRGRLLATLGLAIGLVGAVYLVDRRTSPPPVEGVVLDHDLPVRTEPHPDLPATLVLHAGEIVRVEEGSDRWLRVTLPRGGGWAERSGVGVVE